MLGDLSWGWRLLLVMSLLTSAPTSSLPTPGFIRAVVLAATVAGTWTTQTAVEVVV